MNKDQLPRSPFRQNYEPKDWIFVFAFPTTKRSFLTARAYGEFCHQFTNWDEYRSSFLEKFESSVVPFERAFGLTILRTPKSSQFCRLLVGTNAIVLFAHCDRESRRIEFADGMVQYDSIVGATARKYEGILDLSVCRPGSLASEFKARAPGCAVKSTKVNLDAVGWLWFYGAFFSRFARLPCTYAEAVLVASAIFSGVDQQKIL